MGDSLKDGRFQHIANDPRFKTIPRSQRQVKIDKRFQSMFEDKRFKINYTVDKRGRPISRTSNEDLERYYALSSDSSDSEGEASPNNTRNSTHEALKKNKSKLQSIEPARQESDESEDEDDFADESKVSVVETDDDHQIRSDDEKITDKVKSKLQDMSVDYARGEGAIITDSSSSDEESSDDESNGSVEHEWGELDKDAEQTEEITSRLALCNMDWDRIRAVDLMVLLNSFTPPGGIVRQVTIYPSDYGLQRMKKEEEKGPTELVQRRSKVQDLSGDRVKNSIDEHGEDNDESAEDDDSTNETSGNENEEGSSYHMEKLRQYQLNRLKYFYAIVECDSANTANHIYSECDGMEYESSATRLDLRFVPDGTVFEQEPRETCSGMPDATKYRPRQFTTTALQQAKVELTWDETDPNRTEIANRLLAGDSVDEKDLQAYLASSSGEEDEGEGEVNGSNNGKNNSGMSKTETVKDEQKGESSSDDGSDGEDPIAKYRSLLHGIEEEEEEKKNKDVHMEISWGLGLKEKAEEAVRKRISSTKELTPFQEMMEKRKQKLLERRKQKSLKKMQKSGDEAEEDLVSDDDIPSDIDMKDPYFAEEFKDFKSKTKKSKSKKKSLTGEASKDEQQKQAELELLLMGKDEPNHFNFKKIQEEESGHQSKRKKRAKERKGKQDSHNTAAEDTFQMDVDDKRFSAVFSSHHFNIDPTDPHFRKTNAMEAFISAKQKRLADENDQAVGSSRSTPQTKKLKADAELSRLVKSVKRKAQKMKRPQSPGAP